MDKGPLMFVPRYRARKTFGEDSVKQTLQRGSDCNGAPVFGIPPVAVLGD